MTKKFDSWIKAFGGKIPKETLDALIYVNDTLEIAEKITQDIFGDRATPDITIKVYDLIVNKVEQQENY